MDAQPNSSKLAIFAITAAIRMRASIGNRPGSLKRVTASMSRTMPATAYIEAMRTLERAVGFSERRLVRRRRVSCHSFLLSISFQIACSAIDLAEKLVRMAPVPMSTGVLHQFGSEANDSAMRWSGTVERSASPGKKIIGRKRGYHGGHHRLGEPDGPPNNQVSFDLPIANVLHTSSPHYCAKRCPRKRGAVFQPLGAISSRYPSEGPETVAAFNGEPVWVRAASSFRRPLLGEDPGGSCEVRHPADR